MHTIVIAVAALHIGTGIAVTQSGESPRTVSETFRSATIDSGGDIVIVKSTGQAVVVRKEAPQRSFSRPVLSSARTAVAAQALFENCCTSYDIPQHLVVYARGKVHRFKSAEAIFEWGFADSGTRIAYGQEPVHFSCATHYELREIDSERLIESVDIPETCGQDPEPKTVRIPRWVAELKSKTR